MNPDAHNPDAGRRVLVVKLSSLGDLFHALPAVHLLKKHLHAEVDWVTQPEYVGLVRCFSDVNRVIAFPRKKPLKNLAGYVREVRHERYDYVVDLQGLLKSAVAGRLARGWMYIGPSYQREGARLLYDRVAGVRNKSRHAVDEVLDVVRFLKFPVDEICFPISLPEYPLDGYAPRVALIPCSRWITKNGPPDLFSGLGRLLLAHGVRSLILAGAPGNRLVCERIAGDIGDSRVTNLCGKTSLSELGGVLKQMNIVVTVDSGPMHMAAAAGVPVVAIFGATDPGRTGPYGDNHTIITELGLDCRPCLSRTCRRKDLACLSHITPERIFEAVRQAGLLV